MLVGLPQIPNLHFLIKVRVISHLELVCKEHILILDILQSVNNLAIILDYSS